MANPFSLEGRVALVTGANTGLGQGIALALAEAGADIAGAGIVPADETAGKVRALGRRFVNVDANLMSIEPVDRIVGYQVSWPDELMLRCELKDLSETMREHKLWKHTVVLVGPALAEGPLAEASVGGGGAEVLLVLLALALIVADHALLAVRRA